MINKLDLLWLLNFIALGIYFIFGTKFPGMRGLRNCFNVKCVLFGRSFDFLGDYLVITTRYLVVNAGYWWLLLVTSSYRSLLVVPTFSMSGPQKVFFLLVWRHMRKTRIKELILSQKSPWVKCFTYKRISFS